MSRRDFRLRSVLRARKRVLEAAQAQLGEMQRERARESVAQQQSRERLRSASEELHERLRVGTSAATLRAVDAAMHVAHAECVSSVERVKAIDRDIEVARAAVTDAKKRVRGVEVLEERWWDRTRRDRAKRDQKRLDEIAIRSGEGVST